MLLYLPLVFAVFGDTSYNSIANRWLKVFEDTNFVFDIVEEDVEFLVHFQAFDD
jgi:hypothetical protein